MARRLLVLSSWPRRAQSAQATGAACKTRNVSLHPRDESFATGHTITSALSFPSTRARNILPLRGFFSEIKSPCLPGVSATAPSMCNCSRAGDGGHVHRVAALHLERFDQVGAEDRQARSEWRAAACVRPLLPDCGRYRCAAENRRKFQRAPAVGVTGWPGSSSSRGHHARHGGGDSYSGPDRELARAVDKPPRLAR